MDSNWKRLSGMLGAAVIVAVCTFLTGAIPEANAQDKPLKVITVENSRNLRFGEILVVGEKQTAIYNTTGLNDCPAKWWDAMDLKAIAKQLGAKAIQKNGPHFWMMDTLTVSIGEKKSFGGIEARWAANVETAQLAKAGKGSEPYTVFNPKKTQKMVNAKGKPVYELVDPDGNVYVLQARDFRFPMESLAKLREQMKHLPKGWQYRTRTLTKDLVLDLKSDETIYGLGDEFHQYYTRIPKTR